MCSKKRCLSILLFYVPGRRIERGNVVFRGGNQSFNPAFAKAAGVAIVEVDEIVDVGEIPPSEVDLPGIFIQRVVKSPVTFTVDQLAERVHADRQTDVGRIYDGKRALTRDQMAQRVARLSS